MTDLRKWMGELHSKVEWQRLPRAMSELEMERLLSRCMTTGLEEMFIITGRATEYEPDWITYNNDGVLISTTQDLKVDEIRYALLTAQMEFYKRIQNDVNNIVGYTTDAMTITNADKPYQNLSNTIELLEQERRKIFYSMRRFVYL